MPKCSRKRHGAAKPKTVAPFRVCAKCLAEDWRNYFVSVTYGGTVSWQQ